MADFECTCFVVKGERAAAWGEDCWCWYPKPNYEERIVRCKDCKYGKRIDCARRCYRQIGTPAVGDDGFCAWGEPREE